MYFSHICHFRPTTQPNPLKHNFSTDSRPNPTHPNPTRGSTQPMDNSDVVVLISLSTAIDGSATILVCDAWPV